MAVRALSPNVCSGLNVVVNSNNAASAYTLESRRVTDPTLGACAHEIWNIVALGSFTISVRHKRGADLIFASALCRTHASQATLDYVTDYCTSHDIAMVRVTDDTKMLSPSL